MGAEARCACGWRWGGVLSGGFRMRFVVTVGVADWVALVISQREVWVALQKYIRYKPC